MSQSKRKNDCIIDETFLSSCEKKFKSNPLNIVARNAINSVGSMLSTMNSNRVNEISHVFLNSIKRKNVHATNQGASGRCWMFAALNIFRHLLINAIDLDQFEFSEVYLYFFDKLERANSYLKWFIDNQDEKPSDRGYEFMVGDYMSDGGWWNTFANLVMKYGLVPKTAMKETYQSHDSEDMNNIIKERLDSAVNYIRLNRKKLDLEAYHKETLSYVYDILVKFLGEPPTDFTWFFSKSDQDESGVVGRLTPLKFYDLAAANMDIRKDFVVLTHIPIKGYDYYSKYKINNTNNVYEGDCCEMFNVQLSDMVRSALKSISSGFAVWFACDVHQSFNWFLSSLDDQLDEHQSVFGEIKKFDKGDRILLRNVQSCHAMALTGFNVDTKGKPVNWQVENSWGFVDSQTPGLDGFLNMSHSWFEKYVTQIVVHKNFLTRTLKTKYEKASVKEMEPWEAVSAAMKVNGFAPPRNYLDKLRKSII